MKVHRVGITGTAHCSIYRSPSPDACSLCCALSGINVHTPLGLITCCDGNWIVAEPGGAIMVYKRGDFERNFEQIAE
jgi:hypothetical protein